VYTYKLQKKASLLLLVRVRSNAERDTDRLYSNSVYLMGVCLSVCHCVTLMHCVKTARYTDETFIAVW